MVPNASPRLIRVLEKYLCSAASLCLMFGNCCGCCGVPAILLFLSFERLWMQLAAPWDKTNLPPCLF